MPFFDHLEHRERPLFVDEPLNGRQQRLLEQIKIAVVGGKRGVGVIKRLARRVMRSWGLSSEEK